MNACSNTVSLARYIITISDPREKFPVLLKDVISVSGLGLGDQGSVTLTQQDRIVEIPDGIRTLPNLTISMRFSFRDPTSEIVKTKLFEWYNSRSTKVYDVQVYITNKSFCVQHSYKYIGSSIKNISENDKEMGRSEFSIITATIVPYDVVYLSGLEVLGEVGSR